MDEAKGKFYQFHDDTKAAFNKLCVMVEALNVSQQYNSLGVGVHLQLLYFRARERRSARLLYCPL
jgi:hypothetical protein